MRHKLSSYPTIRTAGTRTSAKSAEPKLEAARWQFESMQLVAAEIGTEHTKKAFWQECVSGLRVTMRSEFEKHYALVGDSQWMVYRFATGNDSAESTLAMHPKETLFMFHAAHSHDEKDAPIPRVITNQLVTATNGYEAYIVEDMIVDHEGDAQYFEGAISVREVEEAPESAVFFGTLFKARDGDLSCWNLPGYPPRQLLLEEIEGMPQEAQPHGSPASFTDKIDTYLAVSAVLGEVTELWPIEQGIEWTAHQ